MTIVDPIGDMFTRIRNGLMRNLKTVNIPSSKFRLKILEILKSEGYINKLQKIINLNKLKENVELKEAVFNEEK